jgi:hypothetical protein
MRQGDRGLMIMATDRTRKASTGGILILLRGIRPGSHLLVVRRIRDRRRRSLRRHLRDRRRMVRLGHRIRRHHRGGRLVRLHRVRLVSFREGWCAWERPGERVSSLGTIEGLRRMSYLEVPLAEYAVIENQGLIDQSGLSELHIRIPAYAH